MNLERMQLERLFYYLCTITHQYKFNIVLEIVQKGALAMQIFTKALIRVTLILSSVDKRHENVLQEKYHFAF